ncbi:paralemmin 3 [Ptychographa xylographoides]|nr:paralemmin 3 [Ptychographa xylographoides]
MYARTTEEGNAGEEKTHRLQFKSRSIITDSDAPVSCGEDERSGRHEAENTREDDVRLEREDEEGEQRKAPDKEIQRDSGIVSDRGGALGGVTRRRIRGGETPGGKLEGAEGEPEDGEDAADHHGEEVAHNPFEDGGEEEQDGPSEEEHAAVGTEPERILSATALVSSARPGGGGKGDRLTQRRRDRSRHPIP